MFTLTRSWHIIGVGFPVDQEPARQVTPPSPQAKHPEPTPSTKSQPAKPKTCKKHLFQAAVKLVADELWPRCPAMGHPLERFAGVDGGALCECCGANEIGSTGAKYARDIFWGTWLLLGSIFRFGLLWFSGKSPLNCPNVLSCSPSNINQG